jgi:hypothetical protein
MLLTDHGKEGWCRGSPSTNPTVLPASVRPSPLDGSPAGPLPSHLDRRAPGVQVCLTGESRDQQPGRELILALLIGAAVDHLVCWGCDLASLAAAADGHKSKMLPFPRSTRGAVVRSTPGACSSFPEGRTYGYSARPAAASAVSDRCGVLV